MLGNRQGAAEVINSLGRVREASGDLAAAAEAHARCLEFFRVLDIRQGEAYALVELGRAQNAAEQYPEALALEGLGGCNSADGDTVNGTDYLRQALAIFERIGRVGDARRVRSRLDGLS